MVIFDQKYIWHNLLGVVYHVKKVSTIFDENWSRNINLKKICSISWKVIWKPIVQWPSDLEYVQHKFLCATGYVLNSFSSAPKWLSLAGLCQARWKKQKAKDLIYPVQASLEQLQQYHHIPPVSRFERTTVFLLECSSIILDPQSML